MSRLRIFVSAVLSGVGASLLPVYVLRSELRNFMVGSGGDRVSYEWSLQSLPGLLEKLRYERLSIPLWLANGVLFTIASALLTFGVYAASGRLFALSRGRPGV